MTVTLDFDSEVPMRYRQQLIEDLNWVYSLNGNYTSPLHLDIFGTLNGSSYKSYFENYVKKVGLHDCDGGMSVACVIGNEEEGKIFLTPAFMNRETTRLMRIFTLFHEARHLDQNVVQWPHDQCPTPFLDDSGQDIVGILNGDKLEGEWACDWSAYGSYGSTAVMMSNIARFCENCTEEEKRLAQSYADMLFYRVSDPESRNKLREDFQLPIIVNLKD